MFYRYAMIVKNLRGVVAFDPNDPFAMKRINWLTKKFRYRNIGVPLSLLEAGKDYFKDKINGKPFRPLYYPVKVLERLSGKLGKFLGSEILGEALVFASTYISPLLLLSPKHFSVLEKYAVKTIYVCKELDNKDWKLHLRIADYTILDMYEYSISRAARILESLRQRNLLNRENVLNEAKTKCAIDAKRYWRIKCNSGKKFMVYIDNLSLYLESHAYEDSSLLDPDVAAGLAIIPAVNLTIEG